LLDENGDHLGLVRALDPALRFAPLTHAILDFI
jgi:hypothetical protein